MIDPRISMGVQVPNLQSSIQLFQNTLNNQQNRRANEQKIEQSAQLFDGKLEQQGQTTDINNQRIDINQSGIDANAAQAQTERQNQNLSSISATIPELRNFIASGDNLGALGYLQRRSEDLQSQGRDSQETQDAIQLVTNGNLDQLGQNLDIVEAEMINRGLSNNNLTSGQRDFNSITAGFSPEELAQAQRVKARISAPAGSSSLERIAVDEGLADQVAASQGKIEGTKSSSKTSASGIAARNQGYIDSGIDAADAVSNLSQTLNLLKTVETGGFENIKLWATNVLGVTGADEAELSANMGKAILAQLKPIFGAAFTAQEGERLEKIEAGFGRSTAGNIRLISNVLRSTERAARRGLAAAKEEGDTFTANEIQTILDTIDGQNLTVKPKSRFTVVVE